VPGREGGRERSFIDNQKVFVVTVNPQKETCSWCRVSRRAATEVLVFIQSCCIFLKIRDTYDEPQPVWTSLTTTH
jgi:hypothetical protein